MKVTVLREAGYEEAMLGLSLSYDQPVERMPEVAMKLLPKGGSHTKFLESIAVWLDVTAPRYWWQQADTYRVGCSKQSGSTMHTLMKRPLTQDDFEELLPLTILGVVNAQIRRGYFRRVKVLLPESFLQRRVWFLNYKVLHRIIQQRSKHKLSEWQYFIGAVLKQVEHPEFLEGAQ